MNVVTDDMVQAALDAYSENEWRTSASAMRAALAAVAPIIAAQERERALAPVTPHDTVAALAEALENLMDVQTFAIGWDNGVTDATDTMNEGDHWHGLAMDRATAALALYRGETGQ